MRRAARCTVEAPTKDAPVVTRLQRNENLMKLKAGYLFPEVGASPRARPMPAPACSRIQALGYTQTRKSQILSYYLFTGTVYSTRSTNYLEAHALGSAAY